MGTFYIKKIDAKRWDEIKELRLDALKNEPFVFGFDYDDFKLKDDSYWQDESLIKNLFFAEIDGNLIGMIGIDFCEGRKLSHLSYISKFYVKKEFRSNGIGKALFEKAISEISYNPLIIKIKLYVNSINLDAINLYEKFGFERKGIQEKELFVEGKYYDEIYMEKLL